jgi:YbbR domain-containing protein
MSENKKKRRNLIPGFIAHDFWRKLIALFFAILVWGRVAARLDDNQNIRAIPVVISMPGYVLLDDAPPKVSVILRGSKQRLNKISLNDIQIKVLLKNPKVDENKILITKKDISIPKGVSIEAIEPDYVEVHLDEKVTKKLPVELKSTGLLMEGYALNPIHLIPQEVTVSGPKRIVGKMMDIPTKPIVLGKEMVEDFDCRLEIDTKGKNISISPQTISARIEIYKKYDVREFKNIEIKPFGYLSGRKIVHIKPQQTTITVKGVKNAVETLTTDKIRPLVDLSGIDEPGDYTLNVQCWLNDKELSVKSIEPSTVNVTISE